MRGWLRNNGLTVVTLGCFVLFLAGQALFGWREHNSELADHHRAAIGFLRYLHSGAFAEATFENWESEFLQMGSYVLLTAWLVQRGSAESRDPDTERPEPPVTDKSPGLVRRGGWPARLYAHSLSVTLLAAFVLSFLGHLIGGAQAYSEEQLLQGKAPVSVAQFAADPEFWFQSMQNWQSEFLAVGCLVLFSRYLRERGSPESKPVNAPHEATGS